uniref:RNA helicase n=1 Tax=Alexandrium monilatum TaxID=311494 RepID=A0A7S4SLX2_9DINO
MAPQRWDAAGWGAASDDSGSPWDSYAGAWRSGGSWSSPSDWRGAGRGGTYGHGWSGRDSDAWDDNSWGAIAWGGDHGDGVGWGGDAAAGSGHDGGAADVNDGSRGWDNDPSSWAPYIKGIDWNGMKLVQIEKNFYEEHPAVSSRTQEEVEEIRRRRDIEVLAGEGDDGSSVPKPVLTFEEAGMPEWLLRSVASKGFRAPTPIQVQVWPVALQGRDLIGIAETGSGKTLAYLLPMMIHIMAQEELKANEGPVGVVMCPTRELALQISEVADEYTGQSGLRCACIYGGVDVKQQGQALKEKTDIVVATPGRFIQLLNEGWTNLNRVTYVALDEADEMLSSGFGEQIRLILSQVRPDRQMLMFSATWPKEVQKLAREHCTASEGLEPVMIRVGGDRLAACRTISQKVLVLPSPTEKLEKLCEAIRKSSCHRRSNRHKCLIFCRTKAAVDDLVSQLCMHGIEVEGIHSDKCQTERLRVLRDFKNGELSCLASTNCLGRGHDIPRVKFVINYDAPNSIESYIHRIGRTGRAGEQGYAMTFLTQKEAKFAGPLIRVLKETSQEVPRKLEELEREEQGEQRGWEQQQQADGAWGWEWADRDWSRDRAADELRDGAWEGQPGGHYDSSEPAAGGGAEAWGGLVE